jgi:O-antigen ligase
MNTMKVFINIEHCLLGLLCTISLFAYSHNMTDNFIVPKWCFTIGMLLLSTFVLIIRKWCNKPSLIDLSISSYIIIASCFFQALYGWGQWLQWVPSNSIYSITGSFDNPAGFAVSLVAGLPFALWSYKSIKSKAVRVGIYLTVFIIISAIILSGSRSGVMSVMAIAGVCGYKYIPLKSKIKASLIIGILCVIMIGGYFMKKGSADGRLLIWRCSWEMFRDAPLAGNGIGCFRAHYMDYQADFFKLRSDSDYAILADNVLSPFNEYLSLLLNYGVIGLLILFVLFMFLLYCYRNNCRCDKQMAMLSLIGIAVFSLFSYPFTYPFVWIIACLDVYVIVRGTFAFTVSVIWNKSFYILLMLLCLGGGYKLYQRIDAEYKWRKIAYFTTEKNLDMYVELNSVLGGDPYFLYNYAVALLDMNRIDDSLEKALQCRDYWADYDLELLLGDIYKSRKEYEIAEEYYKKASLMCPCRFIPLQQMFELFKEIGDEKKALEVAEKIIEKPIKVKSLIISQIKYKMKRTLQKSGAQI